MARRRKSRGLGSTDSARSWFSSAVSNFTRIRRSNARGCSAIEHYTDVIAESTVANELARTSGDSKLAKQAQKLTVTATRAQRGATALCRRGGGD